jgi:hypothetical protein
MMPTSPKRLDDLRAEFVAAVQAMLDETPQSGGGFGAKEGSDYLRAKVAGRTSVRPRVKSWCGQISSGVSQKVNRNPPRAG